MLKMLMVYKAWANELTFADLGGHRWVTYPSAMPMQALLQREMDLAGAQAPLSAISTASTFVTVALLQCSADLVSVLPAGVYDAGRGNFSSAAPCGRCHAGSCDRRCFCTRLVHGLVDDRVAADFLYAANVSFSQP